MGYIERNLSGDEKVIYQARISWAVFFLPSFLLIFLIWISLKTHTVAVIFSVFFSLYALIRVMLIILTTEFALTDRRIIAKKGIIKQRSMEILLHQVESIHISQPLDGRIFGFGTVTVRGSGGTREYFKSISNPMELRKQVNSQISTLSKYGPLE